MKIVILGTYDLGKPRVRILREAIRRIDGNCIEVHKDIWAGIEDKSQVKGLRNILSRMLTWASAYPLLIWRYLRTPRHKVVIIPYFGLLDVFVFWPIAKVKGAKIFWDVFFSTFDTVVTDRKLLKKNSAKAKFIYWAEYVAARIVDVSFLDTKAHSEYFAELYNLSGQNVGYVPVGVETSVFPRHSVKTNANKPSIPLQVLFYGQFIPLHGLDTLSDALEIWSKAGACEIQVTIIGQGQEADKIDGMLRRIQQPSQYLVIKRINWIPYDELPATILDSDINLGIFGTSEKAMRVIPNKVYQILAMGKPLITADTIAIRELIESGPAIELVEPGNPNAVFHGLCRLAERLNTDHESVFEATREMPVVDVNLVARSLNSLIEGTVSK